MAQNEDSFWIPKPQRWDFLTLAILIPVMFSAIGLVLMAIESYVFAQFQSIQNEWRVWISLISAICLAIGGELGSVFNCFEIFSKYIKSKMSRRHEWETITGWDWSALAVSFVTTMLSFFIASSTRPNTITSWQQIFAEWLVLPLILLSAADIYAGMIEGGFRLGTFDLRMRDWIVRRKEHQDEINYLERLEKSNAQTKLLPIENPVYCWCGKQLKSKRAYGSHLRFHINEVAKLDNAQAALDYLHKTYSFESADFEFPTLPEIAKWLVDKK